MIILIHIRKILTIVNHLEFVDMLIVLYLSDMPYHEALMRNAFWFIVILSKYECMDSLCITIQRTFPHHRKSSPNRIFPKKNVLCVFSSFYHALKKRT